MYLLKNITFSEFQKGIIVENGIRVSQIGDKIISRNDFWGITDINPGDFADYSKFEKLEDNLFLIPYVNTYSCTNIGDGYKKLSFNISTYQPNKIEGYIVFIEHTLKDIETNGKKIGGRYPHEIVVVLTEGNYIEFDGKRVEVINNRLVQII